MIGWETLLFILSMISLISPLVLVLFLGLVALAGLETSEETVSRFAFFTITAGLLSTIGLVIAFSLGSQSEIPVELGHWVNLPEQHFHFHIKLLLDKLSLPFLLLVYLLCGVISAFTSRYLHREPGFRRFYLLFSLFTLGMVITSISGTIEVLFFGWELVGLSSALLVGFFHDRQSPVVNGLRVWSIYRIADAAFLVAAIAMHHLTGEGDFDKMLGAGAWPTGVTTFNATQAFWVGGLLMIAVAGKSALIPFSGWLPRAMEGPTPSSAIFYGALSVHLGAFLLLRVSPIVAASPLLTGVVIGLGAATALSAALIARVQSDIKSILAYASLIQVGLIVIEIGLGWHYFALAHILGHASWRTLQLLSAPGVLRDYYTIETALGRRLARRVQDDRQSRQWPMSLTWYRWGWERGYLDTWLELFFIRPFLGFFRKCDRWETAWNQRLTRWLSFDAGRNSLAPETNHQDTQSEIENGEISPPELTKGPH